MSVDTELQFMRDKITDAYNAIGLKGGTIPQNRSLSNLSTAISTIETSSTTEPISRFKIENNKLVVNNISVTDSFKTMKNLPSFHYIFYDTDLTGVASFDEVTQITTDWVAYNAFWGAYYLYGVRFPKLTIIDGMYSCNGMFSGCSALTFIEFPLLHTMDQVSCGSMFADCTSLTEVNFPSLYEVYDCYRMFGGCTSLRKISFPALQVNSAPYYRAFQNIFDDCTALQEIHFRSDMQTQVAQWQGYSNKFGAPNATIYFDL